MSKRKLDKDTSPVKKPTWSATAQDQLFKLGSMMQNEITGIYMAAQKKKKPPELTDVLKYLWREYIMLVAGKSTGEDYGGESTDILTGFKNRYISGKMQWRGQGSYKVVAKPFTFEKVVMSLGGMTTMYHEYVSMRYLQPLIEAGLTRAIKLHEAMVLVVCQDENDELWKQLRKLSPKFCDHLRNVYDRIFVSLSDDMIRFNTGNNGASMSMSIVTDRRVMAIGCCVIDEISHTVSALEKSTTDIKDLLVDSTFVGKSTFSMGLIVNFQSLTPRVMFECIDFHYKCWKYLGVECISDNRTPNMALVWDSDPAVYLFEGTVYKFKAGWSYRRIDFGGNLWVTAQDGKTLFRVGENTSFLRTARKMIHSASTRSEAPMILPFGFRPRPHVPVEIKDMKRLEGQCLSSWHFHDTMASAVCEPFFGLEYMAKSWNEWAALVKRQFGIFESLDTAEVKRTIDAFKEWERKSAQDEPIEGEGELVGFPFVPRSPRTGKKKKNK